MKKIIITLVIILTAILIAKYGRSIYMPIANKMSEKHTVQSRQDQLSETVLERLSTNLTSIGLTDLPDQILIVGYKHEQKLEIYALGHNNPQLIKSYPFTGYSGRLGPKLKEGDRQIPEGIYKIEYLNPNSSYHLSLKINYPNDSDRTEAKVEGRTNIGSDIFIHGKDLTVGCIPIGDEAIEEVFLMAANASRQETKVVITPYHPDYSGSIDNDPTDWKSEPYSMIRLFFDNNAL